MDAQFIYILTVLSYVIKILLLFYKGTDDTATKSIVRHFDSILCTSISHACVTFIGYSFISFKAT